MTLNLTFHLMYFRFLNSLSYKPSLLIIMSPHSIYTEGIILDVIIDLRCKKWDVETWNSNRNTGPSE